MRYELTLLAGAALALRTGGVAGYVSAPPTLQPRSRRRPSRPAPGMSLLEAATSLPGALAASPLPTSLQAALVDLPTSLQAAADGLRGVELPTSLQAAADVYDSLLSAHPLATKSWTNGAVAVAGDAIAQRRDPDLEGYDFERGARFCAKALLGGALWVGFYDAADASTAALAGASRVAASMALEQLLWAPFYFGLYDLPAASLLNGVPSDGVASVVARHLPRTLAANAKIWTPANVVVYSAPLEYRLLIANGVDLLWSTVQADIAADCTSEELCPAPAAPAGRL